METLIILICIVIFVVQTYREFKSRRELRKIMEQVKAKQRRKVWEVVREWSLSRDRKRTAPKPSRPAKINVFVGGPPPPGALFFESGGKVTRTPDSPEARHLWAIYKMSHKIEREPHEGKWYYQRGMALMALDKHAEAVPDFSKLIEFYSQGGDYYRLRGLCYYHAGDHENALEDMRRYQELEGVQEIDPEVVKILDGLERSDSIT